MSQALRQRRSRAARALATHERRGQLGWDDLAAWPDWADGTNGADGADAADGTAGTASAHAAAAAAAADAAEPPAAVAALATRVGAVWHTAALRHCIHGPTLKRLQQSLGDNTLQALISGDHAAVETVPLPQAEEVQAWLQAQGAEVMLAALPSPLLRLALRERLWPKALQQLPSPDTAAAARALARALSLPVARRVA